MSFRFRAQVALDLRRRQEDEAKRALGHARGEVAAAASAVANAEAELAKGLRRARDEELRATDTMMRSWLNNWLTVQRREITTLRQVLARRRDEERAAVEHLLAANRRVRALDRLRERLWQDHEREERRTEQRELDSFGGLRYVANRSADNWMSRSWPDRTEEVKSCQ